jgi:hypothetical protein
LRCRSEALFGDFKSVSARQDIQEDVPASIGTQGILPHRGSGIYQTYSGRGNNPAAAVANSSVDCGGSLTESLGAGESGDESDRRNEQNAPAARGAGDCLRTESHMISPVWVLFET